MALSPMMMAALEWVLTFPSLADVPLGRVTLKVPVVVARPQLHFKNAAALVCHRCGVEDVPERGPAPPPHAYKATCRHCGGFIKWLSGKTAEQREARRQKAREYGPPSQPQLSYLKALGYEGEAPKTIAEARTLIDGVLMKIQERGRLYVPGRN